MPVQLRGFSRERHQNVLDHVQPGRPPGVELLDGRVVQFVHVQVEDALVGTDQQMLIPGLRMDPRRRTVDVQRTVVEDLGKAGTHVNFWRRWQPVGDGPGRRVPPAAMTSLRRYRRSVVQKIRLGI